MLKPRTKDLEFLADSTVAVKSRQRSLSVGAIPSQLSRSSKIKENRKIKLRTKEDMKFQVDPAVAEKFEYIANMLRFTEASDEVVPVPVGAATMQSLVQWAAPTVLQEADLQSLLDMMIAADKLGLPGFREAAVLALPTKLGHSLAQRCQKLEEITESGLPEPVRQHLQGLITDEVRELWEHGSLLITASRELDLRLLAGLSIQGLAMGGGGGFVGVYHEFQGGEILVEAYGGGSGHFAIMNISNLKAIDKKLLVKIGSGGRSVECEDGGDTVVEMDGEELVRALGGREGFYIFGCNGATTDWDIIQGLPSLALKQGRGGQESYMGQGGLMVDGIGPSCTHNSGLGPVEGYGSGGSESVDGKDGVVIVFLSN